MPILREWVRRLWGTLLRKRSDHDLERELALHLELAEDEFRRRGHTPEEAARLARVRFGASAHAMEPLRDQRGFAWAGAFWLDVKLGLRMLRKSWGLTLVGGLAMTVVMGIGAVVFAAFDTAFRSTLPLEEGDRVIAIQTWDAAAGLRRDTARLDYERWLADLRSVEELGAFQTLQRNLVTAAGPAEPVAVAEITASGFSLARVPPLLGRTLVVADERPDATPVVVIGHDAWRSTFASDPSVIGQQIRFGNSVYDVVGVMPEGFSFPVNYQFWTALRLGRQERLRDAEPTGVVFGRLAPGVTLERAHAEVAAMGLLPTAAASEADAHLQPRLVPYTFAFTGDFERGDIAFMLSLTTLLLSLILLPPCANIAILIYARTVTRQAEFAARYVLGAGRGRIVAQLFVEVLVLAAGAAGVALVIARLAIRRLELVLSESLGGQPPFWLDFSLSFRTVLFVGGLALFAAAIAGFVPALKATGRLAHSGLQVLGGRTSMRLGATWTTLVVAQVAFSVAVLPTAVELTWGTIRSGVLGPGFAVEQFLTARLVMDPDAAGDEGEAARFAVRQAELIRRLEAESGFAAVTASLQVPGEEPWAQVEVEGGSTPEDGILTGANLIRFNQVDPAYFDVFDMPLLTGRMFDAGDFSPGSTAVIVTRNFAEVLVGDVNPLGRRVRYRQTNGPVRSLADGRWFEIVGVVPDLRVNDDARTMYHPATAGQVRPSRLSLRMGSNAADASARLREVTTALDPALRVDQIVSLDEVFRENQFGNNLGAFTITAVTMSLLLLSAAGLYALMSFTVNQRRHEIGVRSALGAPAGRLLAGIYRRAIKQLAAGGLAGVVAAYLLAGYLPIEQVGGWSVPGVIPAAAAFMVLIGLLAAVGPSRRGLRIEPTEALRES